MCKKVIFYGASVRSPTFAFTNFEQVEAPQDRNYTCYFRIPEDTRNAYITVHVFGLKSTPFHYIVWGTSQNDTEFLRVPLAESFDSDVLTETEIYPFFQKCYF